MNTYIYQYIEQKLIYDKGLRINIIFDFLQIISNINQLLHL